MKNYIYISAIGLALLSGCKKTAFDAVERTPGTANFKHYISVGNSLTQGYQDGGLYEEGQSMSYPSILAKQMAKVQPNMDEFKQPMVTGNGSGYMHLAYINGQIQVVKPDDAGGYSADPSWANWGTAEKSQKYNNLAVAGIKLVQCVNLTTQDKQVNPIILGGVHTMLFNQDGNPYARFMDFGASEIPLIGGTAISYLEHVKQSNATFFTNWLGNNDVLGYVINGGVENKPFASFGINLDLNALSDEQEFADKYDSIVKAFYDMGAKGICANLPKITSIPYVTTFTVDKLKNDYNYPKVWITDLNGNVREATNKDYVLLGASSSIATGKGTTQSNPFDNAEVLDENEVALAQAHTITLNGHIQEIASKYGYPVVDMYNFMDGLTAGYTFEGIDMTAKYIEGGTFGLDGIHPNPRGYAVVANKFIEDINAFYGSNIPKVIVGNYRGVVFP